MDPVKDQIVVQAAGTLCAIKHASGTGGMRGGSVTVAWLPVGPWAAPAAVIRCVFWRGDLSLTCAGRAACV